MKITKIIVVLLAFAMLMANLIACDTKETGACDMEAVKAEIDSMKVEDFTETDKKTEYVKFTEGVR